MMNPVRWMLGAVVLTAYTAPVRADLTVQQKTTLDVASVIHMHGANTTNWTADKKREDTESHCEGMMSMICGNLQSGEIVRLDRGITWRLEPAKKRYTEQPFATPEELAAMRARMQANIDKINACPAAQQQKQAVDKSRCRMSPPKIDVHKTDDKASFAGHDAQRTSATLTESCTDIETGDVCDTVVALDLWLTQDSLPGTAARREFDQTYAGKLGLSNPKSFIEGAQAQRFLAAYQDQLKELSAKSGDSQTPPGAAADPASKAVDPYAQYTRLASFSTETVNITDDAVPASRFDVPPDWTKEQPKVPKGGDDFNCPKS